MNARKLLSAAKAVEPVYVEDVFSTWLYTGNGSTQTITNGIDLAGKGGMVWSKTRNNAAAAFPHALVDTVRGKSVFLSSNQTEGNSNCTGDISSFNTNGITYNAPTNTGDFNRTGENYVNWTFRKQPKFFDVVTWTGNGSNRTIAHNLGSVPGCIIVKRTDTTGDWQVYHRSLANTEYMVLNSTAAKATGATRWNSTTATSSVFSIGTDATVNASGGTYVAYLFAHDAGGFGPSGTDNVISCGSFTTDGSGNATVNLGYEPQWVILKYSSAASGWTMFDTMRGWVNGGPDSYLQANTSSAEVPSTNYGTPTATGFEVNGFAASTTTIYLAIRRGPMKVPTSGTEVYAPISRAGNSTSDSYLAVASSPVDLAIIKSSTVTRDWVVADRLRGDNIQLSSNLTAGDATGTGAGIDRWDSNTGVYLTNGSGSNRTDTYSNHFFRRAPGFFDVVCYTGTGSARTVAHNLGVAPELLVIKRRSTSDNWIVYAAPTGPTLKLEWNATDEAKSASGFFNNTAPTASVFTVGTNTAVNGSGSTYVAYLFASLPGISKVGSYTGNGTSQTINCGFSAGARFVLIKRTDSAGDWFVWDTARGIVSGDDPHLSLNTTAAEVTTDDSIDPDSSGFIVNQVAATNINVNTATYIYLAIA